MTAMTGTDKPLSEWLAELIEAPPSDRLDVSLAGFTAGIALLRVYCDRCDQPLNWTSAYGHLSRTEASHRLHHGPDARLHEVGDLRAVAADDLGPRPTAWPVVPCRTSACGRPVMWAVTTNGKRMPVDAVPDPAGNVRLTAASGEPGGPPLATVIRTDADRAEADGQPLYTSHFATCRFAKAWRR